MTEIGHPCLSESSHYTRERAGESMPGSGDVTLEGGGAAPPSAQSAPVVARLTWPTRARCDMIGAHEKESIMSASPPNPQLDAVARVDLTPGDWALATWRPRAGTP